MKLFFSLLTAFLFLAPLTADAGGKKGECANAECKAYQRGVHRRVIPTQQFVCVYFVQRGQGRVVMTIYFKDGRLPRRYDNKKYGDHICVGRHWVRDAEAITLCDEFGRALFFGEDLQGLSVKAKFSRAYVACLKGEDACRTGGFKVLPPTLRGQILKWDNDDSIPIQQDE